VRGFGHRQPPSERPFDEIVEQASAGKVSRRQLIATLTALGLSASATATVVGAAEWIHHHLSGAPGGGAPHDLQHHQQLHQQLHQQHIVTQSEGANATPNAAFTPAAVRDPALQARLDMIMQDYHPDAVVHDKLSGGSIQGHDAIRAHKAQEFLSFSNLDFEVTRRYAVQDQVVAEWVARGILHGEFKGLVGRQPL
jgi:SnoaL-like domain